MGEILRDHFTKCSYCKQKFQSYYICNECKKPTCEICMRQLADKPEKYCINCYYESKHIKRMIKVMHNE